MLGMGLVFHFKAAVSLIWPGIIWHKWNELVLKEWLDHKFVGIIGPTNSSKTNSAAWLHLLDYYLYPTCTTILICSTTRERLEDRIWGEMKKLHREATRRYNWLPGHLIEGKQRIVTDDRSEAEEGRDFRNGVIGVPCKKGDKMVNLGDFIGIKNKRLRLCGDELQTLPKTFIDSLSNLMKGVPGQTERKVTGMGNCSDTLDSLGLLCEPAAHLGGWDGGIDQTPVTKTWETRWPDGVCIQLPGSDSPNKGTPRGVTPPYPFLITPENMEDDAKMWGVDDWHYKMFDEGMMPRGQGSRRVITRQMCQKFGAMNEPVWFSQERIYIAFLDAAYRGVGGDRCVFGVLSFGPEARLDAPGEVAVSSIINQTMPSKDARTIMSLIHTAVVPVKMGQSDTPEDQIVQYVMAECQQRNIPPENFFFDSGMRTSLVSAFARVWSPKVESIDFGGKPSEGKVSANIDVENRDYYFNFVTELWYTVRLIIEAGQFRGMTEEMMLEGCAREWKKVGANKIQVETKDEMKVKTGRSPDLFDALVCGVRGAILRGFVIRSLNNLKAKRRDETWKRELRDRATALREAAALNYAA
jgi:hypothetical protein